ncbi:MAG TPA: bifunctional diaminohydroxyphosphoribosylaminopyrimidine deaminase/5-amino-6-(5-phosphoribosylamino)uracil reductase RibD [Gammaproteobacteria bacterium]|nr:bifunctional diaminohydroxyphosphoribosylaminopyrimidine deaminase/5-amino-6-(5-phosphoribosylamino)uracil reductase RibD [Gammaproteobacteria bacterium]
MTHTHFLLQALDLAKIQRGFCSPNPSVGAVIVDPQGKVLATGYHTGPGHAHAEVDALKKLNGKANGATIYITLEPCCHWGRTPPCTDAIIKSGIKHVIYAFTDPNPIVSGKSKALLAAENISCEHFPVQEIAAFYESYKHWHINKTPFVTAKIALTLDGKIAGEKGEPISITGPELKEFTYESRKRADAILTTVKTIISDDPQMNVRGAETIAKPVYILDRELKLPLHAKIFETAKSITLFYAKDASEHQLKPLLEKNVRCIAMNTEHNRFNFASIIEQIGKDGVHDLWVEAGGECFSEFVKQKLLQKILIYIAPRSLGLGLNAFKENLFAELTSVKVSWHQMGNDVMCQMFYDVALPPI